MVEVYLNIYIYTRQSDNRENPNHWAFGFHHFSFFPAGRCLGGLPIIVMHNQMMDAIGADKWILVLLKVLKVMFQHFP